jgi:hypothetical protein
MGCTPKALDNLVREEQLLTFSNPERVERLPSVPNVAFVKIDFVVVQEEGKLILEGLRRFEFSG